jgi:hypothetical protein
MNFDKWLEYGFKKGYCSKQFCDTHDGGPLTPKEMRAWDDGDDPCSHHVRLGTPKDWDEYL